MPTIAAAESPAEGSAKPSRRRRTAAPPAEAPPPEAPAAPETAQAAEPKRKRRARKAETAPAEPEAQVVAAPPEAETPAEVESPPPETPRRRTRRKKTAAEPTTEAPPVETVAEEPAAPASAEGAATPVESAEAPAPTRRRRRRKAKATPEAAAEPASAESAPVVEVPPTPPAEAPEEAPRKTRRRRKKAEAVETVPETAVVEEALPAKPPIRHPLVRVHFHHGVPSITVGEKSYRPFFFFGNPHTTEAGARIHQEMQLAFEAGISLVALLITLPARDTGAIEAFDQVRYWVALARELNPNVQILWRIVPAPVGRWEKEYPEGVIRYADGTIGGPSVCADRWWQLVQEQLTRLVELIEQEEEGAHTLGYHLDWGEWFYPESGGYDTSEAALSAFRDWLRRHYRGDSVSLRACWFDGQVSFSTATLPPFQPSAPPQKLQFYHLRREGRWIDYHRFLSEITAKRILTLAEAVKNACQNRALVGVSYGYLLEWRHPHSGHLALGQLLRSELIDFLSAPITYADRLPGGTGAFPTPVDSVHLHHKLFLSEEDYRTPFGKMAPIGAPATERTLTPTSEPDDYNPPLRSAEAVVQAQARSVGQALTFGYGTQWMDLWGEGWLASPIAWENARAEQILWEIRERTPQAPPDVAVIVDPTSMRYVRTGSRLLEQVIVKAREALMRSGVSVGFYLLEDIVRRDFPLTRMVLFLNAWRLSHPVREAIQRKLQRNQRTLVWLYAGSLFKGHRDALATAREVMGFALARQPWASTQGTQIVKPTHPIARALGTDKLGAQEPWEPSYYVLDEDAEVIGQYIETGLPSLAVKDHGDWRSVFIGERTLTPELIRALAWWAGVHVWLSSNDVLHVRRPWLHLHATRSGRKTLFLPEGISVYDPAEGRVIARNGGEYVVSLQEGESRVLLMDTAERLEALLRGESLPPLAHEEPVPEPEPVKIEPVIPIVAVEPLEEVAPEAAEPARSRKARGARKRRPKGGTKETPSVPSIEAVQWRRAPVERNGEPS